MKAAEEAAGKKVALLEGVHDTEATWSEILDATARKNMRTELRKAGMSNAEIDRLINGLVGQKGTVKVALGTRGVRENYNYRSGQTPAGTSAGPGVERHHGHPLYLGGSHEKNVLFDLDPKAHDAVHDFFEKSLKLPSTGKPPGTSLNPGTIRNAVAGSARPGAAVIDPKTGAVTLKYLDE